MDPVNKMTLMNRYMTIGPAGQMATLVFLAVVVLAAVILIRKADMRFRLSLIPLAFVPFLMGISGLAGNAITIVRLLQNPPDYSNHIETPVYAFDEPLHVVPLTAWETIILLVIAAGVVMCAPGRARGEEHDKS